MQHLVIIGSGLAGYSLLREFRKRDTATQITLISADDGAVYAKPNLSNALAQGRTPAQLASESSEQVAAKYQARIMVDTQVTAIDRQARQVLTRHGMVTYDKLVLALGADPIPHGLQGDALDSVYSVNDLADYRRFRDGLAAGRRVAILGGGLIGCEFANDLAASGHAVRIVHLGAWPLERLIPQDIGRTVAEGLADMGVIWHLGRSAKAVQRTADGVELVLDDASRIDADIVLSAIGLHSRTELARDAGLAVNRGIVVDRQLRSSDPDIHALGDCAEVAGLVLPYIQPLLAQAKALAATLAGSPTELVYPAMPVVVKTPACPLVVAPPPAAAAGAWHIETDATDGRRASFRDALGALLGFTLTGTETGKRLELARQLPPWLS